MFVDFLILETDLSMFYNFMDHVGTQVFFFLSLKIYTKLIILFLNVFHIMKKFIVFMIMN